MKPRAELHWGLWSVWKQVRLTLPSVLSSSWCECNVWLKLVLLLYSPISDTQRYVVTFTTSQSYIEVPGWRKGDIAFSFRTTGEKAILLFQPPIRPYHPSFMVALTGDYQLTFNFTLSTGTTRELVINSHRKLNGGEWHKIWIDYNEYHVRFMINTDYQMVDLLPEEEFGPFEGSMYIGGATA